MDLAGLLTLTSANSGTALHLCRWRLHLRLGLHALVFILGLAHHPVTLLEADRALESFRLEGLPSSSAFPQLFVRISDWWERERHFGEHATGRFASFWRYFPTNSSRATSPRRPKLIIGGMLRPIGIKTEKHFVTIASTGGYKSTGALIPNLCIHEGSMLVVDPRASWRLSRRVAGARWHGVRGIGQPVFVLDPFHIVPGFVSASYNVFDEMESVAKYDADRPPSATPARSPRLWSRAPAAIPTGRCARTFISGLLLYIFQGPKEHRNLVRLRELIMEGDKQVYAQVIRAGGDKRGDAFDALLTMMKQCPEGPYRM